MYPSHVEMHIRQVLVFKYFGNVTAIIVYIPTTVIMILSPLHQIMLRFNWNFLSIYGNIN